MSEEMLDLTYFKAPVSHTQLYPGGGYEGEGQQCSYCGKKSERMFWVKRSSSLFGKKSIYGCLDCLLARKYSLENDTEIGEVTNGVSNLKPPKNFSKEALIEIGFTPPIAMYQAKTHFSHCKDFMVYIGRWDPEDFVKHSKDGDGRKLWMSMINNSGLDYLWDQTMEDIKEYGDDWPMYEDSGWSGGALVYVFMCRHCGKYRCYWDCD